MPQRPTASDAAPSPFAEPLDSALGRSLQVYEAVVAGTEVAA